jgi:hypothetical protein
MVIGGMPAIVNSFVTNKNYSGTLKMQRQILLDYEEDITKYAVGLDQAKVLNVYRKIPAFLGSDNKKFQISKVAHGARNRDYVGTVDWLDNAGIVNICHCMEQPSLPLGGNYDPNNYKLYFSDTGLLVGSLDEEVQEDLFGGWRVTVDKFLSDRVMTKIHEYNEKAMLNAGKKGFQPIEISDEGLELIEYLSLDCTAAAGEWHSDSEIKIDKLGYVTQNGSKTKTFWDGSITSDAKPLRLKIRNICGDETVWEIEL